MNKIATINELILISNSFDKKGLYDEANCLDKIILSYAISEGLVSEAGAREFLSQIGGTVGSGLDLAYQGAKKLTQLTWNKVIKPAGKEVASTIRVRPAGSLLIALLANTAGGLGVSLLNLPYSEVELNNFVEQNEDSFVDRVLSHAIFKYEYKEYEVQEGDNLSKIVEKLYPNQDGNFYQFAIDSIVENNDIKDRNALKVGQTITYAENLPDALSDSAETVVSDEITVDDSGISIDSKTDSDEFFDWIAQEEGKRSKKYKDGNGFWTIGIGHRLTPEERKSGKIKINGEDISFENGLSDDQIKSLYEQDRASHNDYAKRAYTQLYKKDRGDTSWENLKSYEKQIFEDFTFNVGPGTAKQMLRKVIAVEGKLAGPGMSSAYQRYLGDKGIWARRTTQTMWSRGAGFTKSDLDEIVGLKNATLGRRVLICLSENQDIKTKEAYKDLVEDLKLNPGKSCKRWGG